jgi:putative thioredoxin
MIDTTLSSFERDVIEASMEVPVIVDFWAPWCGPSKLLGPLLERLEREYGGRFKLVNVNSDTNPELVSSFNLKSIPYAVAFVDGNAVAQFMGAQPEAFVRAFLDRLIPNPAVIEHRAAREALAKGQPAIAADYLKNAIALDPSNEAARLAAKRPPPASTSIRCPRARSSSPRSTTCALACTWPSRPSDCLRRTN